MRWSLTTLVLYLLDVLTLILTVYLLPLVGLGLAYLVNKYLISSPSLHIETWSLWVRSSVDRVITFFVH